MRLYKGMPAMIFSMFLSTACGIAPNALAAEKDKAGANSGNSVKGNANAQANAAAAEMAQSTSSAPESEMDRLLAILVQKRLLTKDEATAVRAEVKNEEQAAPVSDSTATEPPAETLSRGTVQQPKTVSASTTLKDRAEEAQARLPFKISGFAQMQWTSLPGVGSTFQLRRGRISISGDIHKLASYKIQVDVLNTPALLDAYLQLKPLPFASLTFGQFKVPFSQENLISSSDLLTIERSQVVNSLVPGRDNGSNGRDIGATVGGSHNFTESTGVDYAVGIFNGAGINRKDDNNRKDFVMRLAARPLRGLGLVGDFYNGAAGVNEFARDRQGAEIGYSHRPLTLSGEFIWGRDGTVHKQGWYGLAAWRFSKPWEAVFRADGYDPDRSIPGNTTNRYLEGLNLYFADGLKWQLNYGTQSHQSRLKSLFLSQLQFRF